MNSKIYTDEYPGYRNLKKYGFVHKQVCHSQKEYARGVVHVNNCECRSNLTRYGSQNSWVSTNTICSHIQRPSSLFIV